MEGDEVKTREVRVLYRSLTIKEEKEQREKFKAEADADPTAILWLSEELMPRLVGLPDLTDEVTLEWLENEETKNLRSIEKAIKDDLNPKPLAGSSPEK